MKFLKSLLIALGALFAVIILGVVALVLFYPGLHSSSLEMALNVITGKGSDRSQEELLARLEAEGDFQVSVFAGTSPIPACSPVTLQAGCWSATPGPERSSCLKTPTPTAPPIPAAAF